MDTVSTVAQRWWRKEKGTHRAGFEALKWCSVVSTVFRPCRPCNNGNLTGGSQSVYRFDGYRLPGDTVTANSPTYSPLTPPSTSVPITSMRSQSFSLTSLTLSGSHSASTLYPPSSYRRISSRASPIQGHGEITPQPPTTPSRSQYRYRHKRQWQKRGCANRTSCRA